MNHLQALIQSKNLNIELSKENGNLAKRVNTLEIINRENTELMVELKNELEEVKTFSALADTDTDFFYNAYMKEKEKNEKLLLEIEQLKKLVPAKTRPIKAIAKKSVFPRRIFKTK
jgi:hypothetical protein